MKPGPTAIDALAAIQHAALSGKPCPKSVGPDADPAMKPKCIVALRVAGWIKIEIFKLNFRRITILKGEHAGKATAGPPDPAAQPYLILQGPRGGKPSMPRPLSREELA